LGLSLAQQAELIAPDGGDNDDFGFSVAVSGTTAVVGAVGHGVGSNQNQGAAYVFVLSGGSWTQQAELTAADGATGDQFGWSVAMSGSTIVVGAATHTVGSNLEQGAAYVFVGSGASWTQQAELTAADGAANDEFGWSVAASGSTVVVGVPDRTVGSNSGQGAAYVYVQSGGLWTQQAELTAADGGANDEFGYSVALSGSTVILGAPDRTVGSNAVQGVVYVYVQSGGSWTQQAELTAADGSADGQFGWSVSISSSTLLVGATDQKVGSNSGQGAAYVYVQSGGSWTQQAELTAADGAADDQFGQSVAVSGSTAVVGAIFHQVGSNATQGAAYVYALSGGSWSQQQELTAADGASDDRFGFSVALSGSTVVAGAINHQMGSNLDQGAAYVYGSVVSPSIAVAPNHNLTSGEKVWVSGRRFPPSATVRIVQCNALFSSRGTAACDMSHPRVVTITRYGQLPARSYLVTTGTIGTAGGAGACDGTHPCLIVVTDAANSAIAGEAPIYFA
jgi:hypothetical protein